MIKIDQNIDPKREQREQEYINIDKESKEFLNKKEEDLLKEINCIASTMVEPRIDATWRMVDIIPLFSALFIILSQKAEKQTKRIINLTWMLLGVTVLLLGIAVYQYRNANIEIEKYKTIYNTKMDSLINAVKMMPMKQNQTDKDNKKDK